MINNEEDILKIIYSDKWMMEILGIAKSLNLPGWMIGAGFVRNKIWDYLHGYKNDKVPTADIDLIYFDNQRVSEDSDIELSRMMREKTGIGWEIVNQAYTHKWHNRQPYKDTEEALADWVEVATCVAVSLDDTGLLHLHAPLGIEDLINLVVRKNPRCSDPDSYLDRVTSKGWKDKWPKLHIIVKKDIL